MSSGDRRAEAGSSRDGGGAESLPSSGPLPMKRVLGLWVDADTGLGRQRVSWDDEMFESQGVWASSPGKSFKSLQAA